ncbi:MAG: hypothetical protein HYY45_13795 [Deltaproteobacteria bacterium]|nr:hypothetical protein [Deltaproteobacteria bacterium]
MQKVIVAIFAILLASFGIGFGSSSLLLSALAATGAPKEKPFYQGKTITLIAASAPGGGTDTFSRLIARFLPRHIRGNPNIIVQNMPGGNNIVGANHVYTKTKPDGLTILTSSGGSLVEAQLQKRKGVLFDITRMHVFIGTGAGSVCFVSPETGIRQPRDLTNPKVDLFRGGAGKASSTSFEADIPMQEIFKVKRYRPIYGYDSMGPARLAFTRGETNMHCDNTLTYGSSAIQQLIQTGRAVPVFQSGLLEGGELKRHPGAADVPTVAELHRQIYGSPPSGIAWEAFRYHALSRSFGKITAFPPETPRQGIEEIQQALKDLVKDPEWIAETDRVTGEALVPPLVLIGEEVEQAIREYMTARGEVTDWLEKWVKGK